MCKLLNQNPLNSLWSSYLLHSFLNVLHSVGGDQGVQRFIFPWEHLSIFPANLPLLHRAFTTDHDLSTALLLDVLQCITTGQAQENMSEPNYSAYKVNEIRNSKASIPWTNQQADKVDFRIFILRDHNFVVDSGGWRSTRNGYKIWVCQENLWGLPNVISWTYEKNIQSLA